MSLCCLCFFFFFFNDTATTEIYTLSLHDALPISLHRRVVDVGGRERAAHACGAALEHLLDQLLDVHGVIHRATRMCGDRKSTRLNSSHDQISYAVFCLKKKKTTAPRVHTRPHHAR